MSTGTPTAALVTEALNRAARRIFQAGRQADWCASVLDAALEFSGRVALFRQQQGSRLVLEAASFDLAGEISVELAEAPALKHCLDTREPVVSAWSARELSTPVLAAFGNPGAGRAYLFAIAAAGKSVGLLIAKNKSGEAEADANGLELVCALAGAAWELRRAAAPASGLISLTPVQPVPPLPEARDDQEWHRRAQRFASVRVAELRLYQAAKVRQGRESSKLYEMFREEIDRERSTFRAEFLEKSPSMRDYLHEELVRTLAQGEASRMGESYPGAMVCT